jgi:hypothetical protein
MEHVDIRHDFYETINKVCDLCEGELNKYYGDVVVSASCMPTRSEINFEKSYKKEALQSKDMGAYKRLRKEGIQPKSIDGSAHFESRAQSKYEISAGTLLQGNLSNKNRKERALNEVIGST